jgi:hypothetical protein
MRNFDSWQALRRLGAIALLAACALAGTSALAEAAPVTAAPGWEIDPIAYPSNLAPGGQGYLMLEIYNVGKANSSGEITVTDTLPAGVTATEAGYVNEPFVKSAEQGGLGPGKQWNCSLGGGKVVTCTNNQPQFPSIPAGEMENLAIAVDVSSTASGSAKNEVTVAGGGALTPASTASTLNFGDPSAAAFGFQRDDAWFSNANGTLDTQAGSHPYSLSVLLSLNNTGGAPTGEWRNIKVNLPRGLIGNPTAMPRCTAAELNSQLCPSDSQVGVDRVSLSGLSAFFFAEGERPTIEEFGGDFQIQAQLPVYNMVPPPGAPAELGFSLLGLGTRIDSQVRSGSDYGISEVVKNILQTQITFNSITVWGVPGDPSHDYQRVGRTTEEGGAGVKYGLPSNIARAPFLTLPSACEGPQSFSAMTEPWAEAGIQGPPSELSFQSHENSGTLAGITGCDHLTFNPTITVAPDTSQAETPAGLTVEVKTPQEGLTSVEGLAASNIKNTTVTLPEGVVINPGQAHGLQTCSTAQSALGTEAEPSCPNAAKVGSDEIETPLLFHNLKGNVYVLDSNPPNLKLLVAASGEGVNLKLVGDVHLDESTGRLTTTFSETPELPFTTFRLSFSGGAQAALYTPQRCGNYKTTSDFTPWSEPSVPDSFPGSEFQISSGVGGAPCPTGALPFAPSLTAGSTTDQAGGYTNFSLLLSRPDGQQRISKLQFKTPKGLLGMISKVPLCQEPQAAQGNCPAASQIGHTTVESGPGPYPLVIPEPGQPPAPIYLTAGYEGAPYGLSIAVPVIAGPFDLGTVVVRSSIAVDRRTAQLTITTDPLPSILDGVPTDLRAINAVVDKPGFMFNPTNCESQSFSGTASSTEGASAPIESHFQMGSCRSLQFHPDFKVSTSAQSSKANGASLDAKILYPTSDPGNNQATSQSAISSVKVDLPIQLPSRLTTLQKACLAKVFEEDPAKCPKESLVGNATAITPVLPVALSGPAYFVSHGGEAFPSLIIILQGYGVSVELIGTTLIKNGITSSTFKQVPDVPITSFDLNLPEGHFSALGANLPESAKGSFCGQKLVMPTAFTGQNGAVVHQNTPISIQGCSNTISLARHSVKGKTLTLSVYAPAAGKIKVSANGLASATKTAKGQENITIKLQAKRSRPFKTKLKLSFQPGKGKGQKVAVAVAVRG